MAHTAIGTNTETIYQGDLKKINKETGLNFTGYNNTK